MKNFIIKNIKNITLFLALLFLGNYAKGQQMSGSVTINPSGTASTTVFGNWYSFWRSLQGLSRTDGGPTMTSGIASAVSVTVTADVIETQAVTFPPITGMSATNTITIDGGGNKLIYTGTTEAISFTGGDYFTIKNLVVRDTNTATNIIGVRFSNASDNNTLNGCTIEFNKSMGGSTTTTSAYVAFAATASALTSVTAVTPGSNCTITNCIMRTTATNAAGPCMGIALLGNSGTYTSTAQNLTISNNTITNFFQYGIYQSSCNGNQITGNDISRSAASSASVTTSTMYGIYSQLNYGTSRSLAINSNNIHDLPYTGATASSTNPVTTFYGIYLSTITGNTVYDLQVKNNTITKIYLYSSFYGVYAPTPNYMTLSGNKVQYVQNYASATMYGYYLPTPTSVTISNNIYSDITSAYYSYGYVATNGTNITVSNNTHVNVTTASYLYAFDIRYPKTSIIDGNLVQYCSSGGYTYAFDINDGTSTGFTSTSVTNNTCDNLTSASYIYNFYCYYFMDITVKGNKVTNTKSTSATGYNYCFYMYYGYSSSATVYNVFEENLVQGNTGYYVYGFYLYYYNTSYTYNNWQVKRNKVIGNNAINGIYGLYVYYCTNLIAIDNVVGNNKHIGASTSYMYNYLYSGLNVAGLKWEIRNNTWQYDATTSPVPGSTYGYYYLYPYYVSDFRYTGNIVDYKGGYYLYFYYYNYGTGTLNSGLKEWDYNDFYIRNWSSGGMYYNGTSVSDYNGLAAAGYAGPNDQGVNPEFSNISGNDFRAREFRLQNKVAYNSSVPSDIDKVARNTGFMDCGAYETPMDVSMQSSNYTVPDTVCSGYSVPATYFIVKNSYALDSASGLKIAYSINGGAKVSQTVSKKILSGDTGKVFFVTNPQLNVPGKTIIKFFIDRYNDNLNNDTLTFKTFVKPAPGGGRFVISSKYTWAYYQLSKPVDVTVLQQPVIYNSPSPRAYSNALYGSQWKASAYAITNGGNSRPASEVTYTAPSGGNDLEVQYKTTDAALVDSTVTIYIKFSDLTNGCDTIIKRQVLIYPTIVAKFNYPAKICDGDAVLFENKSTVHTGNMEFMWTFGTGKPTDVSEQQDPQFTFPTSGTYKVIMKAMTQPYGFPSWDSATITIGPKAKVDFDKTNACEGKALTFTNQTIPSNVSFNWNFGDNATSNLTSPSHTYAKTGSYKVSLTATLNGCASTVTQYAYQFDKPVAGWNYVSGTCDNDMFVLNNTSTIKNGLFGSFWNLTNGDVSTDVNPHHMFNSPGNKSVKLVVTSEFGCKDSMTKTLNVKESPKVTFTNTPACSLIATQFINQTPSVSGTIANYDWDFGDGSTSKAVSPSHNWSSLGTKTVTLSVKLDNSCQSSYSREINVLTQPKADFKALSVCSGSPVVFENNTTWAQGDISYNWNFADGAQSTASDPLHDYGTVTKTSTYMVTLYANIAGGCSDSITKPVTVNESPKTCDFKYDTDYGFGRNAMKFQAMDGSGNVGGENGVSYTWVIENGGNKAGAVVEHDFLKDGVYTITMRAKVDATNCECTKTKQVVMDRTGVEDLSQIGAAIFPNPTSGNYSIALTNSFGKVVKVEMLSLAGSVVKVVTASNNGLLAIDASDLVSGIYLVRISSGENMLTRKLTIQK